MFCRLFEGFVAAEIAKQQVNSGRRLQLYYFRDQQGLEIELIAPQEPDGLALIEVTGVAPERGGSLQPSLDWSG